MIRLIIADGNRLMRMNICDSIEVTEKCLVLEESVMAKNDRFEKVYSQGTLTVTEIWVDKETGVNYVFHASGYAGGMTPLLDRDGKPVVTPVIN